MTSHDGPPGCSRSLPEVAASPLLPPFPDCQGGVQRKECVPAKECGVEKEKSEWMAANAARGHLVDLSMSRGGMNEGGVEGSLGDFLLEQAGVSY